MYYESRYVVLDGTFKPALTLLGAVAAPFALFLLPRPVGTVIDMLAWGLILALMGALVGTVVGALIDSAIWRRHVNVD
jgi:uncharacterized membrane protein YdjX (TVP38/TMEM64 family)